jgi:hypothetical protein
MDVGAFEAAKKSTTLDPKLFDNNFLTGLPAIKKLFDVKNCGTTAKLNAQFAKIGLNPISSFNTSRLIRITGAVACVFILSFAATSSSVIGSATTTAQSIAFANGLTGAAAEAFVAGSVLAAQFSAAAAAVASTEGGTESAVQYQQQYQNNRDQYENLLGATFNN